MFNQLRSISRLFQQNFRCFQTTNIIKKPVFIDLSTEIFEDLYEPNTEELDFLKIGFDVCYDLEEFLRILNKKPEILKNLENISFEKCVGNENSGKLFTEILLKTKTLKFLKTIHSDFYMKTTDFDRLENWKNKLKNIFNNSLNIKVINNILANNGKQLEIFNCMVLGDWRMRNENEIIQLYHNLQPMKTSLKVFNVTNVYYTENVFKEFLQILENSSFEGVSLEPSKHLLDEALSVLLPYSKNLNHLNVDNFQDDNLENLLNFMGQSKNLKTVGFKFINEKSKRKLMNEFPNIKYKMLI